jgi:hypothetical protein
MKYNEIKKHAEDKNIRISDIADAVGMTSTGFKRSIEMESFPIGKVRDLCDILQISIAEFFGEATPGEGQWVAAEAIPYNMGRQPSGEVAQLLARVAELKEDKAFLQAQVAALTGAATKKTKSA